MSAWGHLAGRFENKKPPHRVLALDGGGIRGILTLEVLGGIEKLIRERSGAGSDFRLCDWFDYIGGTSTGAIIAAGLARGKSVSELLDFYQSAGRDMFDKRSIWSRWKSLYENGPLEKKLKEVFGSDTDLSPEHMRCMLLVVTKNTTTDSPWPISSNPLAKYNDRSRPDCNLQIPLWQLVRASTAAPVFFPPEVLHWDPRNPDKSFVFVDGGMTPYNNPAFLMYRMATQSEFHLGWVTGEDRLLVVSVGTGGAPQVVDNVSDPEMNIVSNLSGLPGALMYACSVDQDTSCRAVGRCTAGDPLDREIDDLIPRDGAGNPLPLSEPLGRAFLYARYNAELTDEGLRRLGLSGIDPEAVSKLDSIDHMDDLRRIGRAVAAQVRAEHFGSFLR